MNKKIVKKNILQAWIRGSDFVYNAVETLPLTLHFIVAIAPVFLFWAFLAQKKAPYHLAAIFSQDQIMLTLSSWFNLTQDPFSLPASFLVIGVHTLNIALFWYLARPYLSKLMVLWVCWYTGIHPSHLSWFGKLEYFPQVFECTLVFLSIIAAKFICKKTTSPTLRLIALTVAILCWTPINIWLGSAIITLAATYFWPLPTHQCSLLFISYLIAQLTVVLANLSISVTAILINIRRTFVGLLGLEWIPSSQQWLRYVFLLFWASSLVGLFLHTTKRRQVGLLVLAMTTYLLPQVFIQIHPAFIYTALPGFMATLGLLYENTGEADVRSVIKSLIIPIFASFFFNVAAILLLA